MRKKLAVAAISTALVLGTSTSAFAKNTGNNNGNGCRNRCGGSTSTVQCVDSSGSLITVNALNCSSVGLADPIL